MLSITAMISTIRFESASISPMVSRTRDTDSPPATAIADASAASVLASLALPAFCWTMAVSSSMLAAVCSSDDACSSVR
ncbi:hypothetical protein D3C85_1384280 [compost metagenome]